jgi:hypothetical protein
MATISNQILQIDAYLFNATGNAFVRKETQTIPLPVKIVPCSPGPDRAMRVYSKILYGVNYQQEIYVGQSISQLQTLLTNA